MHTHHLPCGHLPPEGAIPPREGRGHTQGLERLSAGGRQSAPPAPLWTTLPWIPSATV